MWVSGYRLVRIGKHTAQRSHSYADRKYLAKHNRQGHTIYACMSVLHRRILCAHARAHTHTSAGRVKGIHKLVMNTEVGDEEYIYTQKLVMNTITHQKTAYQTQEHIWFRLIYGLGLPNTKTYMVQMNSPSCFQKIS